MKIENSRGNKGHTVIAITASKTWIMLVQTINLIIVIVDVVENSSFFN